MRADPQAMVRYCILLTLCFVGLGCTPVLRNLTAKDVRTQRSLYRTYKLDKTISELQAAAKRYARDCRGTTVPVVDPDDPKRAFLTVSMPGLTKTSVVVVQDFEEIDGRTTVASYVYWGAPGYRDISDDIIEHMVDPSNCD